MEVTIHLLYAVAMLDNLQVKLDMGVKRDLEDCSDKHIPPWPLCVASVSSPHDNQG